MIKIGKRLKKYREDRNLTQKEVSDKLKIHQVTYLGYEKDKHEPSLEMLIKLAELYKTSTDDLLGRYEKNNYS